MKSPNLWRAVFCLVLTFAVSFAVFAILGYALASNHTLDDYAYYVLITVDNQSGGSLTNSPVAVPMQATNLVSAGALQADAEDLRPAKNDGTTLTAVAQGMTSTNVTWWLDLDSLANNTSDSYKFHMGNTSATRDQTFRLDGTGDKITTADHADLDVTNNLTLTTTAKLLSIPSSISWLAWKQHAYGLGVRSSNEVVAAVWRSGNTSSITVRPNAAGTYTQLTDSGCGSNNWDCVDEASPDDDITYVYKPAGGGSGQDSYNLQNGLVTTIHQINSVTIYWRSLGLNGTTTPFLRLSSSETTGSPVTEGTSYADHNQTLSRPGGGAWTNSDIESLEAGITANPIGGYDMRITQMYIVVTVIAPDYAAYNPISANTQYVVKATYDGTNLKLYTDGTERASTAAAGTINTTSTEFEAGNGINGWLDAVSIGTTSIATPTWVLTWDMEPDELEETQQGKSSNSWTYLGTVEDVSAGGVDHDGSYTLTRTQTGITVLVGGLTIKAPAEDVVFSETISDVLGTIPLTPQASIPTIAFPLKDIIEEPITRTGTTLGITLMAWWWLLTTAFALGVSIIAYRLTGGNEFLTAISFSGVFIMAYFLSVLPLWVPLLVSFVSFSSAVVVRRWARES